MLDDQAYVFDELYRGRDAQRVAGSGLGLALTRSIIARHGGTISLRSREGEGTQFGVRLPLTVAVTNSLQ